MANIWLYSLTSVLIVSLISLVGVITLSIKANRLKSILIYMISFSAGALFGDAFIHLLPEVVKEFGFGVNVSLYVLSGIILFFVIEKLIHWRHCHLPITHDHVHPYALMNLVGDCVHNFIDGIIIGASYLVNIQAGIATTIAVILHEIPQEISDFGVLIHGGFSRSKALLVNFMTALTAVLGAIIALVLSNYIDNITSVLVPITVGGFIYIAGSDLIPELHKDEFKVNRAFFQILTFILGVLVMLSLVFLE